MLEEVLLAGERPRELDDDVSEVFGTSSGRMNGRRGRIVGSNARTGRWIVAFTEEAQTELASLKPERLEPLKWGPAAPKSRVGDRLSTLSL